ncbi:MAG: hypothetical protein KC457_15645, partial [Myxococcales bacterium]|nr:hypothetical protein [Myxococcales bacterium]
MTISRRCRSPRLLPLLALSLVLAACGDSSGDDEVGTGDTEVGNTDESSSESGSSESGSSESDSGSSSDSGSTDTGPGPCQVDPEACELGTVCDVVPLQGINRAFVAKGLLA